MSYRQLPGVDEPLMDRRKFLKAAVVSAAAAAAAGASAAVILENGRPTSLPAPPPAPRPVEFTPTGSESTAELLSRLASLKAENIRLASQLDIAQSQLASARSAGDPGRTANETLQARLTEAENRAGGLAGQVSVLAGLVALYEQLEEVDVSAAIESGLESVGELVDDLSQQLPSVSQGLEAGQTVLRELEEEIPLVEDGWQWMRSQVVQVGLLYRAVELTLENVTEAVGDFLHMLHEWFQGLLKWLPFGIGDKAVTTMNALSNLLASLPETLDGLDKRVAGPLDGWLEKEEGEVRLQRRVIKPVQEQALSPAREIVIQASSLQSSYRDNVLHPAGQVAEQRQAMRRQIDQYRQTHHI